MHFNDIGIPGAHVASNPTINLANRTAATLAEGSVGFLDTPQADADSTTVSLGLDNVVAVTTARMAQCPVLAVASLAAVGVVDNDRGEFHVGEGIKCRIRVDSTTDIAKGDKLKPVNAGDHMVKASIAGATIDPTGTAALDRWYAEALEARTTNDEGLVLCRLYSSGRF
jgi:hypothetical protein